MSDRTDRTYIAIDLKSFYASVECASRNLDPMNTNLVVADPSRTSKTICLAVSPSLKAYGISGRARLFEVEKAVKDENRARLGRAHIHEFTGQSVYADELAADPTLELSFIIAPPRMRKYMEISSNIYQVYLKYIAPEDIHVYSIDEVLMDVTDYLDTYRMTARDLARTMINDVLETTGITATAGIGTNLYLCKVAMDIVAKHIEPDENGVRIAELDEMSYRKLLWCHEPLTDFWRVGRGIANKLRAHEIYTMGDIARCSLGGPNDYFNEDLLYRLFGVNAELLIDHAWGWEPARMADIKAYKPENNSVTSGQVLQGPTDHKTTRLITREMIDMLSLDLVEKGLTTNQLVLTISYDIDNLTDPVRRSRYHGPVTTDRYGRQVPKHAHGTIHLPGHTNSTKQLTEKAMELFDRIVDPELLSRRINIAACNLLPENEVKNETQYEQMSLFDLVPENVEKRKKSEKDEAKEKQLQKAMLSIKNKYGKNAILKGMNLEEGATARSRNNQVGGHKA